jgi:carbonic anhydrase
MRPNMASGVSITQAFHSCSLPPCGGRLGWRVTGVFVSLAFALWVTPAGLFAQEAAPTPAAALERLNEGNARFAADRPAAKDQGSKRRAELARGQYPFAVIITCSDSRVPPETIFDQGLGDLFVIRLAGNVVDTAAVGSVEFAVGHRHVPLVVVLGHEECGAVQAALDHTSFPGDLGRLVAMVQVGNRLPLGAKERLLAGTRANAVHQARELVRRSPVIKDFVDTERARIVIGLYGLTSGKVQWLDWPKEGNRDR